MSDTCNCGCDNCGGECVDADFAPVKECVPVMKSPNYALGLDCERRKRRLRNLAKSILTSDGDKASFKDGSEEERIALNLIEKAYSEGVVTIDGAGQLQLTKPPKDGKDRWFGHVSNIFGLHEAPTHGNRFNSKGIELRNCGKLALIVCDTDGTAKLAQFEGCEGGSLLYVNGEGELSCYTEPEPEVEEEAPVTCRSGFLSPYFLDAPHLAVDKWPGLAWPWTDGTVGVGSGSFGLAGTGLPDIDKIKRLILYVEAGAYVGVSGNARSYLVEVNNEEILHGITSMDQFGSSQSPGLGLHSNECTAIHAGTSTASWKISSRVADDFPWKLRIFVKGAYYDHCEYAHTAEPTTEE